MKRKNDHTYWLLGFGLFWAFCITLLRGLHWPNDWAKAHWLINYDFGLLKRALIGTLVKPLILSGTTGQYAESGILILSTTMLTVFCVVLMWMSFRILLRKSRLSIDSVLLLLTFQTSPYIVMSGYLNGYFDNILIVLSFWGILLVLNGKSWAAAIVITIGLFIHETIFIVGFPSVLFAAILYKIHQQRDLHHSTQLLHSIVRYLAPFVLPILAFVFLFLYQSFFIDAEITRDRLSEHLAHFEFIKNYRQFIVPDYYVENFVKSIIGHRRIFLEKVFNVRCIYTICPGLLILLLDAKNVLKNYNLPKTVIFAVIMISLLPLSLQIIAFDTFRVWTYPLIVAMLSIWTLSEIIPIDKIKTNHSPLFSISCVMVIFLNIFMRIPLMGGAIDRYSSELRILIYMPSLMIVALIYLKNYYLTKRSP